MTKLEEQLTHVGKHIFLENRAQITGWMWAAIVALGSILAPILPIIIPIAIVILVVMAIAGAFSEE